MVGIVCTLTILLVDPKITCSNSAHVLTASALSGSSATEFRAAPNLNSKWASVVHLQCMRIPCAVYSQLCSFCIRNAIRLWNAPESVEYVSQLYTIYLIHPILDDNFKILDTCDPFDPWLLECIYIRKKKTFLEWPK